MNRLIDRQGTEGGRWMALDNQVKEKSRRRRRVHRNVQITWRHQICLMFFYAKIITTRIIFSQNMMFLASDKADNKERSDYVDGMSTMPSFVME